MSITNVVCPVLELKEKTLSPNLISKAKVQSKLRVIRPLDKQIEERY